MKKIVALVLAAMMIVAVFASCGNSGETTSSGSADSGSTASSAESGTGFNVDAADFGEEKGATLKVWGPDAYVKLLKKQCDAFTKKFPDQGIKINVVAQGEDTAATNMLSDADAAAPSRPTMAESTYCTAVPSASSSITGTESRSASLRMSL